MGLGEDLKGGNSLFFGILGQPKHENGVGTGGEIPVTTSESATFCRPFYYRDMFLITFPTVCLVGI
jgi:hypothetical protein